MKYYYKVVTKNMRSYAVNTRIKASIKYKLDDWNQPNIEGSRIFIFKRLKDALNYVGYDWKHVKIFRCAVINPVKLNYRAFDFDSTDSIKSFWNQYLSGGTSGTGSPTGTYGADAIKLVAEIDTKTIQRLTAF